MLMAVYKIIIDGLIDLTKQKTHKTHKIQFLNSCYTRETTTSYLKKNHEKDRLFV